MIRFTNGPHGVFRPDCGTETEVGGETRMLASVDITRFAENVDFVGVEGGFGSDGRHTSGPETQTQFKVTDTLVWGV